MGNNEKKDKKKYTISIGWKRSLIVTLVAALILGTYSFADLGPKAQAAEYSRIVNWDTYTSDAVNGIAVSAELENGKTLYIPALYRAIGYYPGYSESPVGARKYRDYSGTYAGKYTKAGASYISASGDLYSGTELIASGVKDYVVVSDRHFVLFENGTVSSWGKGAGGELGIGYKADKTALSEVVDPTSGEPIEGIKKIFIWSHNSSNPGILMVTDGKVYLIGYGFGKSSYSEAKPVDISSSFPVFTSANDFNLSYLEGIDSAKQTIYDGSTKGSSVEQSRRIFTVNGENYALIDIMANDQGRVLDSSINAKLIKIPSTVNPQSMKRISSAYNTYSNNAGAYVYQADGRSSAYYSLDNGTLTYWGTTYDTFGTFSPKVDSTVKTIATDVESATGLWTGTVWYVKKGNLYAIGSNNESVSGVQGGALTSPTRITGPGNEFTKVSKFETSQAGRWVLLEDGTLYGFKYAGTSSIKKVNMKFLDIFSHSLDSLGKQEVFGIGEDYNLYFLDDAAYVPKLISQVTAKLAPVDYVAPVTNPDKPVLSISSQDKFNQSVVTINYGTTSDVATKQYQINGGGWLDYTGEIVITQSGNVTIQARSADSNGNMSEVGELTITSDPIVITAGHPKIDKIAADEFKISADATGTVKVLVRVDGAAWQDFNTANNLLLTSGNHTIEVRLLNDRDQELINKTFDVTADNPAPVVVGKPSVTQKGLNNQFGLDIDVSYDASEGEALYSIDGGEWIATTGSFSVSNAAHTIRAKVVTADGKESEVTEFVTTVSQPKITVNEDQVSIELGINTSDVTVHYKDSNNQWVEYTGPVSFGPGTHNIEIEVRDNTGTPVFNGGPYTVTVIDPNAGNPGGGDTTPTPDLGTGTPIGEEDVDFTVNSGGLSSRFEGADLSTIIIDNTNPYQSINSVSRALIEDSRGNGKGYQYSLDVTDFVSDPMQDNSTNSQSLVVSIPANSLSVDVLNTKTITGPAAELSNVGKHVFTGTGPEMLATAKAFEGMGYVEIPLNFTLSIPDRVKIISSGSGSKFVPGESTGLMAGIYKSRFTFTLSSGI
ncbi:OmpL47-type beta-barrel domain-containing protein [Paenibacillus illinoisensis]|uniref:OmpL47-type beta-barrel domain-containing protein n=1 Tax=Paenibacillus illinoisensis TaxID=59845 RepID=UPI003017F80B